MVISTKLSSVLVGLALAVQPHAGNSIPEPSELTLFSLGVAGLLIGRRLAMKRRDRDRDG